MRPPPPPVLAVVTRVVYPSSNDGTARRFCAQVEEDEIDLPVDEAGVEALVGSQWVAVRQATAAACPKLADLARWSGDRGIGW